MMEEDRKGLPTIEKKNVNKKKKQKQKQKKKKKKKSGVSAAYHSGPPIRDHVFKCFAGVELKEVSPLFPVYFEIPVFVYSTGHTSP